MREYLYIINESNKRYRVLLTVVCVTMAHVMQLRMIQVDLILRENIHQENKSLTAQSTFAHSKDFGQAVHLRSLSRAFTVLRNS